MQAASLAALLLLLLTACQSTPATTTPAAAPQAEPRPSTRSYHGKVLQDDYLWLKDSSYPVVDDADILAYLEQENRWFEQQMAPRQALVDTLFTEMKGRVEDDVTEVPWRAGDYYYRWRFAPGSEYRLWERRPVAGGDYVVILDEAAEAQGLEFFTRGTFSVSPDGRYLAWGADINGSERYRLVLDDLETGQRFDDGIDNSSAGDIAWAADSRTVYYGELEPDGWYTQRVKSHRIGTPAEEDRQVFYNPDRGFFLTLTESASREYAVLELDNRTTSEVHYFPTNAAVASPQLFTARRDGLRYSVDHGNGLFYVLTNDQHINYRIATTGESATDEAHWQTLLPPSDEVYYKQFAIFENFLAVQEVSEGLNRIRIREHSGAEHHVAFPETVYTASLERNADIHADTVRIGYESMITPYTVYDYAPAGRQLQLRRQQQIPSGYDKAAYTTTRIWAPARDGARVPVSLVYRKDVALDGSAPLVIEGYGAYGYGLEPYFSTARLSLLDRGVVYVIAHVRGGDELGRQWYLDGKLEQRTNTFNDFVDSSRYLVAQGYGREGDIAIIGGSAGGELIGAAVVQAPELYRAAILQVPFVDVLNTMLDDSLPLTPPEWEEWGNPITSPAAFDLLRSYSPYDNIAARDYPAMLVTGGLNDPRVTYWEPAKWTAKMRALKTDDNELILNINMGAGHQGRSGRYAALHEKAEEYAFILTQLDVPAR